MQACFGRRPREAYFRWKYMENPAGELIAFEAVHEGRVAAFYGLVPWHFNVRGERRLFYQSMDTMTHPDYQRRGLFVKLANMTYAEVARRMPDHVLVGIPGITSYPGFVQKLGWLNPFHFKHLFIPRFLAKAAGLFGARLDFLPITGIDETVRGYFERREKDGDVITPALSPEFLKWRVLDNQSQTYSTLALHEGDSMIGFVVYRRLDERRTFIEIVDFVSSAHRERPFLPAIVRRIFADTAARSVFTWEPTRGRVAAAYRRAGFLKNPFSKGPFSYAVPFIVRSPHRTCHGLDLNQRASYDLQPLMQD